MKATRWVGFCLLIWVALEIHAAEPPRVALVIGNAQYQHSPRLQSPINDATAMAARLKTLGFRLVGGAAQTNVKRAEMARLLRDLGNDAHDGDTALFYYAGHGIAFNGDNWLLPIDDGDVQIQDDVPAFGLSSRAVIERLGERSGGTTILILDAGRDNPLPDRRRSAAGTRGLVRIGTVPVGTFILYAAGEKQTARDGLMTGVLLKLIGQPGMRLEDLYGEVLDEVSRLSEGRQEPTVDLKLTEPFFFVPGAPAPQIPAPSAAPDPPPPAAVSQRPAMTGADGSFRDCADDSCPWLIRIPPGHFPMGSPTYEAGRTVLEGPVHDVSIAYPLAVGKYPVTRGQWQQYLQATGHRTPAGCVFVGNTDPARFSWNDPGFAQKDDHPVVCVNWNDTRDYLTWLSRKTGHHYRLLSEAEYEYAARAGTTSAYFWGDAPEAQCRYANGNDASARDSFSGGKAAACNDGHPFTSSVGALRPNAFGLYDMIGNAASWVQDSVNSDYDGAPTDGSAWMSFLGSPLHHIRGASWISDPEDLRSAARSHDYSERRSSSLGFRVARTE